MEKNLINQLETTEITAKQSISKRFRNINMALFVIITVIILFTMYTILQSITNKVSEDYARLYADNAVGTLNTYLSGEIAVVAKTAQSNALIEWFEDEASYTKKVAAYYEMLSTINVSTSKNIYVGVAKTLNEYTIEDYYTIEDIEPHAVLSPDFNKDNWYFECVASQKDYILNVDIDKIYNRKRVWLNYKVTRDDKIYGVICTGLEFSQVFENLFSEYGDKGVRSLIIDEEGYIHMDSDLLGDENFLHTLDTPKITDKFTNDKLRQALQDYIKPMDGYYDSDSSTTVLSLTDKDYQYATIAPISSTTWSVITLYNSDALFDWSSLTPVFIIIPIIFIIFILLINATLSAMMLKPLSNLVKSIHQINRNFSERIYGLDRSDEIGVLASTIQNMKDSLIDALSKAHYDGLTSIYNRRYFDENMRSLIDTLYKTNSPLSILLLDIDHFKNYNDTYGHNAGDICLKKVAAIISETARKGGDFVARYGGEEFVIVLPNTGTKEACIVAKKVLDAFKKEKIPHMSSHIKDYVTVSIGVATKIVNEQDKPEDYVVHADKALYLAKATGRNRYVVYKEEASRNKEPIETL